MHDDSNIRTLRGEGLHLVKTDKDVAQGDVERRVAHRIDGEPVLNLVPDAAQADDLEPTVRELPNMARVAVGLLLLAAGATLALFAALRRQ